LENKKKGAAQVTHVISSLEGKISRFDQRSKKVLVDCQKLLNDAIEMYFDIFKL
jgi:hypothetical protein